MKTFVNEFQVNDQVETTLMVVEKKLVPFRDPAKGRYLSVSLADRTGQIEARAWENADRLAAGFEVEDIVAVNAMVEEFKETHQLRLLSVRRLEDSECDLADFLAASPRSRSEMETRLEAFLGAIDDCDLARLLQAFFGDAAFRAAYLEAPAAKRVHHNYVGGLLQHSLEVAELVATTAAFSGPEFARDLAITGALLHDIGKLQEYNYRRLIEFSTPGKLLGHTVIGYQLLQERIARLGEFPEELGLRLGHIILSHHGELAHGAPVLPSTIEAAAVHCADQLSAQVRQFAQIAASGQDGAWSNYDSLLGRSLYLGDR